eukprot:12676289-Alexandrium_andersonii.AAC.1
MPRVASDRAPDVSPSSCHGLRYRAASHFSGCLRCCLMLELWAVLHRTATRELRRPRPPVGVLGWAACMSAGRPWRITVGPVAAWRCSVDGQRAL